MRGCDASVAARARSAARPGPGSGSGSPVPSCAVHALALCLWATLDVLAIAYCALGALPFGGQAPRARSAARPGPGSGSGSPVPTSSCGVHAHVLCATLHVLVIAYCALGGLYRLLLEYLFWTRLCIVAVHLHQDALQGCILIMHG